VNSDIMLIPMLKAINQMLGPDNVGELNVRVACATAVLDELIKHLDVGTPSEKLYPDSSTTYIPEVGLSTNSKPNNLSAEAKQAKEEIMGGD